MARSLRAMTGARVSAVRRSGGNRCRWNRGDGCMGDRRRAPPCSIPAPICTRGARWPTTFSKIAIHWLRDQQALAPGKHLGW